MISIELHNSTTADKHQITDHHRNTDVAAMLLIYFPALYRHKQVFFFVSPRRSQGAARAPD